MGTSCSADLLQDTFISNFTKVGTLDIGGDTVKGSSQSILGRGVNHLGSDWSSVWGPGKEDNFGSVC